MGNAITGKEYPLQQFTAANCQAKCNTFEK